MPARTFLLAAILVTALHAGAVAAELVGVAHVVDGDTLDVDTDAGRTRIRLNAMDAPEALQTCQNGTGGQYACGAEASAALRSMVDGRELRCEPRYIDRYRRTVRMARRCSLVA